MVFFHVMANTWLWAAKKDESQYCASSRFNCSTHSWYLFEVSCLYIKSKEFFCFCFLLVLLAYALHLCIADLSNPVFQQTDGAIRSVALSANQKFVLAGLETGAVVVFNVDFNKWQYRDRYSIR